jgi:hypothetical protein
MPSVLASLTLSCLAMVLASGLELLGRFDPRTIPESSGIVKSRRYPEIFWVHNDSGNPPLLFAIRRDGRVVRQFRLEVPSIDWEDIAIDDAGYLYLGDIGNNTRALPVRTVYRIGEPDPAVPAARPLAASAAAFYSFPKGARFDAEGLVYDRGRALVVAKYSDGRQADVFSVSFEPRSSLLRPVRPQLLGRLVGFVEPATGASLSVDRKLLAVCAEAVTRVYHWGEAPPWRLCAEVRYPARPIEGVAWDGGDLILVAEGQGVYRLTEATWRVSARGGDGPRAPGSEPRQTHGPDRGRVVEKK